MRVAFLVFLCALRSDHLRLAKLLHSDGQVLTATLMIGVVSHLHCFIGFAFSLGVHRCWGQRVGDWGGCWVNEALD